MNYLVNRTFTILFVVSYGSIKANLDGLKIVGPSLINKLYTQICLKNVFDTLCKNNFLICI